MKSVKATVILSGLKHLNTKSFLKGMESSFFQSKGNFCFSGVISLYHSLNLLGASFSRFWAKDLNSSSWISPYTLSQAYLGNQSREHSTPGLGAALTKKSISACSKDTSMFFFYISLKVIKVKKMSLCLSKSPLEIH